MLDAAFDRHVAHPSSKRRIDRFAFQEGLVSALWQSWCAFCRSTLIESARGTTSGSGRRVSSPYAGWREMEIAYVARELAQYRKVSGARTLMGRHLEPTWGDLRKVNLIVKGISSSNQAQLFSAFGVGYAIKDLQLCRNANSHLNKDRISEVSAAKVRYSETKFVHPSDLIFWIDPTTKDFLWKTWLDEMEVISKHAII